MFTFHCMLGHSFKKTVIITLLSVIPTTAVLHVQANDRVKLPAQPATTTSSVVNAVNINSASAEELADALKGVGLERAKAIVAWRKNNGQFQQVDDLLKVKGIGKKILSANAEKITL